ncbi:hypothetical protein HQ520_13885 [bacterium]|nr:hypothetical protein [bacterium]
MSLSVTIPRAIQLVIDDMGRRMGIKARGPQARHVVLDRLLEADDYETIARIGQATGTRPQCAMELCDWDPGRLCAQAPTSSWMGKDWDNSRVYGDGEWVRQTADIFRRHPRHLEFALHGLSHDYWEGNVSCRGEWVDARTSRPWPAENLQSHLDVFMKILSETGLDRDLPYRAPESFVPCYFNYYCHDGDPESTGALMARNGIRYASTPFTPPGFATPGSPPEMDGVFDSGLLLLDRDHCAINWDQMSVTPPRPPKTSICGIHWANIIAEKPEDNPAIARRWIDYLLSVDREPGLMLAPNMEHCVSQWAFHTFARIISAAPDGCQIDLTGLPSHAWDEGFARSLTLEWHLSEGSEVKAIESEQFRFISSETRSGKARLTLAPLNRGGGTIRFS